MNGPQREGCQCFRRERNSSLLAEMEIFQLVKRKGKKKSKKEQKRRRERKKVERQWQAGRRRAAPRNARVPRAGRAGEVCGFSFSWQFGCVWLPAKGSRAGVFRAADREVAGGRGSRRSPGRCGRARAARDFGRADSLSLTPYF